jgi:hypothetical protein
VATKKKTGTKKNAVGSFNFGFNAKPRKPRKPSGVRVWRGQSYGS